MKSFADLRKEYALAVLRETDLDRNPFNQFHKWFEEAKLKVALEPNAMTVATATRNGEPSARMVLLKHYSGRGFVFYTNYESQKGRNLAENNRAALLFHWAGLERQVRISGIVTKVSRRQSAQYFHSRSRETQLGAWVSQQSTVITGRAILENKLAELRKHYEGKLVPLPPYWGGYCLSPREFEFWQGRESRLHDRLCYTFRSGGRWEIARLSP
jgi:pyridoxamine 5'-phosphate oxidase